VGGLTLGSDALQVRLQNWDGQEVQDLPEIVDADTQTPLEFDPLPDQLPPPGLVIRSRDNHSDLRYALVGLLFEGEEQLEKGLALTKRVGRFTGKIINPLIRPITKIPNPAQKSLDRLAARGQSEIDRWVSRGREEEYRSRQLAQDAASTTLDESITYMAQNPALEELVQQQSVSFANQILELIRGNAVSADYFFEGLVRYALRRRPRYLLPEPSPEVQSQAAWKLQDIRHEDL
jgi:hypothetical protein